MTALRILVVASEFPRPDTAAGDLRLFTLLTSLALEHDVLFCALSADGSPKKANDAADQLARSGIRVSDKSLAEALASSRPDVVWFEFFHQVRRDYLRLLKTHCPSARSIVDSVDVHFKRLERRAALTGAAEDAQAARRTKARELEAYASVDMVIAVGADDREVLRRELPHVPIEVVPLVHALPAYSDPAVRQFGELVFVGGFRHDPNVDAVLYFCRDILPAIVAVHPAVRVKIIGSRPPPEVVALANEHVEVVGYVPDIAPYLQHAYISVAPLRYGAGMKGKVSEAMSYGLPVVTTSIGAEGFGLVPGRDLLVGDTPQHFAEQVIALLDDVALHRRVARAGHEFVANHYSVPVVRKMLDASLEKLMLLPRRQATLGQRLATSIQVSYARHVAWRLQKR